MTIRLLAAYDIYPQNAIVTLAVGTESGLIASGQATATITGGVAYVAPAVPPVINSARVSTSGGVSTIIDDAGNVVGSGGTTLWKTSAVIPSATPIVVALGGIATSVYRVSVNPVAGDTITVESGTSVSGPWTAWPDGPQAVSDYGFLYPGTPATTHVRFTRSVGSGTTSRYYIDEISN